MINKRGQKARHPERKSPALPPMSRASSAASCSCRPNCRPFIATWLKRPCSKLSRMKLGLPWRLSGPN